MRIRFPSIAITAIASVTLLARSAESPAPNPPATAPAPVQLSSGAADILKLAHAKVNDSVTLAFIHSSGLRYDLTANEIIYLRSEGVSDQVLAAMLNQPAASTPETPPPAAPANDQSASAPQFAPAPTSTTYVETVPSSTVYVAAAPAYYTFADPWPYWSCWYPYPCFSFGFYWGSWAFGCWNPGYCYNGYWNNGYCSYGYWNNYCNYGNPPPGTVSRPVAPHGTVPPGVRTGRGATTGTLAATGTTRNTTTARPTSYWSNNSNRPTTAQNTPSQSTSALTRQTARPMSVGNSANARTASDRATVSRNPAQVTRNTSTVNQRRGPTSQPASVRPTWNQSATVAMRSPRGNVGSSSVQYRPSVQPRYAAGPSASYQRSSSFSPAYSYRSTGSSAAFSRPSLPAYSGMSSFRGGGFSSAPRMSAGGGFSRGGGGGGFARGGGGGGRAR